MGRQRRQPIGLPGHNALWAQHDDKLTASASAYHAKSALTEKAMAAWQATTRRPSSLPVRSPAPPCHARARGDAPARLALGLAALADGAEQAAEGRHGRQPRVQPARVHVEARPQKRLQAGHGAQRERGPQLQARDEAGRARLRAGRPEQEEGPVLRAATGALGVLRGAVLPERGAWRCTARLSRTPGPLTALRRLPLLGVWKLRGSVSAYVTTVCRALQFHIVSVPDTACILSGAGAQCPARPQRFSRQIVCSAWGHRYSAR